MSNIVILPDISHIANDHSLHACLMQRGDESRGRLVLNILDLVLQFLQLPLLRPDEPLVAFGTFLHAAIDAAIELGLELIAVLDFRPQEPPIQDVGLLAIVSHRHMHLAQVNPCHLLNLGQGLWLLLLIGGYRFVLGSCPMDDHDLWQVPAPIQDERHVATAIGQSKLAIRQAHSRTFVLAAKVPLATPWRLCNPHSRANSSSWAGLTMWTRRTWYILFDLPGYLANGKANSTGISGQSIVLSDKRNTRYILSIQIDIGTLVHTHSIHLRCTRVNKQGLKPQQTRLDFLD